MIYGMIFVPSAVVSQKGLICECTQSGLYLCNTNKNGRMVSCRIPFFIHRRLIGNRRSSFKNPPTRRSPLVGEKQNRWQVESLSRIVDFFDGFNCFISCYYSKYPLPNMGNDTQKVFLKFLKFGGEYKLILPPPPIDRHTKSHRTRITVCNPPNLLPFPKTDMS